MRRRTWCGSTGAFADLGRIDVVISNAGYGLFGAAEELTDTQVDHFPAGE